VDKTTTVGNRLKGHCSKTGTPKWPNMWLAYQF